MFDMLANKIIVCYGKHLQVLIGMVIVFLFFIDNFLILYILKNLVH